MGKAVTAVKLSFGAACAVITSWLGGWDMALSVLIGMTIMDYLTGLTKGFCTKTLSSDKGIRGGVKKISIYIVVALAVQVDNFAGSYFAALGGVAFRSLVIGYYIAVEGLSILENLAAIGVPLPKLLTNALEQIKKASDAEGGNKHD